MHLRFARACLTVRKDGASPFLLKDVSDERPRRVVVDFIVGAVLVKGLHRGSAETGDKRQVTWSKTNWLLSRYLVMPSTFILHSCTTVTGLMQEVASHCFFLFSTPLTGRLRTHTLMDVFDGS